MGDQLDANVLVVLHALEKRLLDGVDALVAEARHIALGLKADLGHHKLAVDVLLDVGLKLVRHRAEVHVLTSEVDDLPDIDDAVHVLPEGVVGSAVLLIQGPRDLRAEVLNGDIVGEGDVLHNAVDALRLSVPVVLRGDVLASDSLLGQVDVAFLVVDADDLTHFVGADAQNLDHGPNSPLGDLAQRDEALLVAVLDQRDVGARVLVEPVDPDNDGLLLCWEFILVKSALTDDVHGGKVGERK
mmetsp:Transcript_79788/g.165820  ORF Transcript_79788/g.165820 Transcript_79788/m.165820 type:complete len:243 (-) Transcript_79788:87-815(-)